MWRGLLHQAVTLFDVIPLSTRRKPRRRRRASLPLFRLVHVAAGILEGDTEPPRNLRHSGQLIIATSEAEAGGLCQPRVVLQHRAGTVLGCCPLVPVVRGQLQAALVSGGAVRFEVEVVEADPSQHCLGPGRRELFDCAVGETGGGKGVAERERFPREAAVSPCCAFRCRA